VRLPSLDAEDGRIARRLGVEVTTIVNPVAGRLVSFADVAVGES